MMNDIIIYRPQNRRSGSNDVIVHLQRAGTVKAGRTQTVKWAAEGARKGSSRVFCDVRHTSVAGNMLVFRREQGVSPEPRWHRGTVSVLDMYSCHGRIFLYAE